MKTGKKISILFQEGEENLRVQPSAQAWRKLERRLDNRHRHGMVVMMRWLSIVAALFILLIGFYFWSTLAKQPGMAIEDGPIPNSLEELIDTDGCAPYCATMQFRRQLPADYAYPVKK